MVTKTRKSLDIELLTVNRGLFFDRPVSKIPDGGLISCNNVRISEGKIIRDNMGWAKFYSTGQLLDGPVTLIDNFFESGGSQFLIFGTTKSLYQHDAAINKATYINPVYVTGTITSSTASAVVTGSGTLWNTTVAGRKNAKVGDDIFLGTANEDDPTLANWGEILTVDSDTQVTLTANAPVTLTAQPHTITQKFSGNIKNAWNTEIFYKAAVGNEDTWYGTNGVDDVVKWNGTAGTVTRLNGLGFTCLVLVAKSNLMVYGNLTVGGEIRPKSIRNSDTGDPEEVVDGLAAENVVDDGVDDILNIFLIGDNLAIYSGRSITLAQFVGSPAIWAFRKVIDGIGPLSGRAIIDFGDTHEFLGPDSQYAFDGLSITEINGHVWRNIIKRRGPDRLALIQSHINEETGDLLWTIPLATDPGSDEFGAPTTAFVQHYLEEPKEINRGVVTDAETPYTQRDMIMTASGFFERTTTTRFSDIVNTWADNNQRWNDSFFQAAFPFNLFGDELGNIFILGEADSKDGTDISSSFRMGRFVSADGRFKALMRRIYPFFEQLIGTVTITVFNSDTFDGPAIQVFTGSFDMELLEDKTFISVFKQCRYYEIEFSWSGTGKPLFFSGMIIENKLAGKR